MSFCILYAYISVLPCLRDIFCNAPFMYGFIVFYLRVNI